MISWADVMVRQMEHERKVHEVEQTYWMRFEPPSALPVDRWQWRVMNAVGGWLVEVGCRLQTRVETAQQVVRTSQMTLEAESTSTQPCP